MLVFERPAIPAFFMPESRPDGELLIGRIPVNP